MRDISFTYFSGTPCNLCSCQTFELSFDFLVTIQTKDGNSKKSVIYNENSNKPRYKKGNRELFRTMRYLNDVPDTQGFTTTRKRTGKMLLDYEDNLWILNYLKRKHKGKAMEKSLTNFLKSPHSKKAVGKRSLSEGSKRNRMRSVQISGKVGTTNSKENPLKVLQETKRTKSTERSLKARNSTFRRSSKNKSSNRKQTNSSKKSLETAKSFIHRKHNRPDMIVEITHRHPHGSPDGLQHSHSPDYHWSAYYNPYQKGHGYDYHSHPEEHESEIVHGNPVVSDHQAMETSVNDLLALAHSLKNEAAEYESKAKEVENQAEVVHHQTGGQHPIGTGESGHAQQHYGHKVPILHINTGYPVYHLPPKDDHPVAELHKPEPPHHGLNPYEVLTSEQLDHENVHETQTVHGTNHHTEEEIAHYPPAVVYLPHKRMDIRELFLPHKRMKMKDFLIPQNLDIFLPDVYLDVSRKPVIRRTRKLKRRSMRKLRQMKLEEKG